MLVNILGNFMVINLAEASLLNKDGFPQIECAPQIGVSQEYLVWGCIDISVDVITV